MTVENDGMIFRARLREAHCKRCLREAVHRKQRRAFEFRWGHARNEFIAELARNRLRAVKYETQMRKIPVFHRSIAQDFEKVSISKVWRRGDRCFDARRVLHPQKRSTNE